MPRFNRIEVVANCASGSVGDAAPAELETIFTGFGLLPHIHAAGPDTIAGHLSAAVEAAPDLLVVLAGDGTARAAAELCGPNGPLLAPLPGGTMNMLPHAIYGQRSWQDALTQALEHGVERTVGGGAVDGRTFLVAAILGSPALWAPAREAARMKRPRLALMRARRAMRRAFRGRLRYSLDGGPREKAEALTFLCPLTSRALHDSDQALEAAALDPAGAAEAFRLGLHAILGDWRDDPAVEIQRCRIARVWAASGVPAILDGETVRLGSLAEVVFRPDVVRILALPKDLAV